MNVNLTAMAKTVGAVKSAEPELQKLKTATENFEAIFLKKLFSQMRSTVKDTQFGQTFGKEIFDDMFNEAMANSAAKSKTLGMGDMLYKQFAPRIINGIVDQAMRSSAPKTEVTTQGKP